MEGSQPPKGANMIGDRGVNLLDDVNCKKAKMITISARSAEIFFDPFPNESILGNFYEKLAPLFFNGQHRGHAFKHT